MTLAIVLNAVLALLLLAALYGFLWRVGWKGVTYDEAVPAASPALDPPRAA